MTSVKGVPGKGLGVLAERDFSPGEEIISESVTILCSRGRGVETGSPTAEQARQIYQNYNRLSSVDKFRVKSLYCMGERSILNIFSTNSFTITSKYCGLFVKISRINHACDPNACYNNNGSLEKVVTALREINKGEEITISYITNNWDVRSERRSALSSWGFTCQCAVCLIGAMRLLTNDNQRKSIANMDLKIAEYKVKLDNSLESQFCDRQDETNSDEENCRNRNADIYLHLPQFIKIAEKRIELIKQIGNQLTLQLFSAHLDCLTFYLKAQSMRRLPSNSINDRIYHHGETVSSMAQWNIDWRYKLCSVVAKAFFFHIKWTFAQEKEKSR